ncbi:MAG: hypothetical protein CL916_06395 [Deltaproteobacteria bacterium]|nr:hypothetical protein [Deltaproteobacteria bacterium]
MKVPSRTTKIDPKYILIFLIFISGLPIYILWPPVGENKCTQDVIPFWNGEYPEPVVVIKDKTTQNAYVDLCLDQVAVCTIRPGLIHPWSKLDIKYASKPQPLLYRSLISFSSDLIDYSVGTELMYEGETPDGMCSFRVGADRWYTSCQFLEDISYVSGNQGVQARQFFFTSCDEGYKGWIEVQDALFNDLRIDRGLIKGYGLIAAE